MEDAVTVGTVAVIPAKAGIHTSFPFCHCFPQAGICLFRRLPMDSRLRGNDEIGQRRGVDFAGIGV